MSDHKKWSCYTTCAHDEQRLFETAELIPSVREGYGSESVFIDPEIGFQQILGFGGALTEASGSNLNHLSDEDADALIESYYSSQKGLGYTFCRVHMNSCDFSLGNYSCAEEPDDQELKSFQIDRDKQCVIPWLLKVRDLVGEDLKILVSPWSPSPWMKTNKQMNEGGKLLPQYADAWANCYVKFIESYRELGLPIWGVTIQNEPGVAQRWDSCEYSAEEERDFVRDHLGPAFERAGLLDEVKIIVWDHNRDEMVQRGSVIYGDPAASRYVWGTGFHWYANDCFRNVGIHHEAWPDKHLIFTEGCQEWGTHIGSWSPAERYARSIINDLNNWTEAWIDWNLILNEAGGPNHVKNLCSAPVLVDRDSREAMYQPAFYYLGHFSRFIKPGALRILCSATFDDCPVLAVKNSDGQVVVVMMNDQEKPKEVKVCMMDEVLTLHLPARAICTLVR